MYTVTTEYDYDLISTVCNDAPNANDTDAVRLERRLIEAITQYVLHQVSTVSTSHACRYCNQPMHSGMTSNSEPYYGCRHCGSVFLIKPSILSDIFHPEGRIRMIAELIAVEGVSFEVAAHTVDDIGILRNITARRQIYESGLLYKEVED